METDDHIPKFIRRLMPNATEGELREATDNFRQYMSVIERIYQRIAQSSPPDSRQFGFRDRVEISPPV
jgi:hypothetical protein